MIHTIQWLKRLASAGFICACVPLVIGTAQGADSAVPVLWGVAPMTNGAYLESFDTALPVWAGRTGDSVVTNVFSPAITGLPARSNAWFGADNAKVLWLDTAGTVLTNSLLHQDSSAVSFASSSVLTLINGRKPVGYTEATLFALFARRGKAAPVLSRF